MEKQVATVAAEITRWGARQAPYRDLISEAARATLQSNKKISKDEIKSFVLSIVYPERSKFKSQVNTSICCNVDCQSQRKINWKERRIK